MERRPFSEVLMSTGVNIEKEYDRLYWMFYNQANGPSVAQYIESNFDRFPYRGTTLSLADFDETYKFRFERSPSDFDINYLINFCEYCYNLCSYFGIDRLVLQINMILELVGYDKIIQNSGLVHFVEKNPAVISVAEIVSQELAPTVLEYNHHSLKGNVEGKKKILRALAGNIEPKERQLYAINQPLKNQLFYLFNNFNIRHNNREPGSNHNKLLDDMSDAELESIYDDTYQMWLLATLLLDNRERTERIKMYSERQRG